MCIKHNNRVVISTLLCSSYLLLSACATQNTSGTLASLNDIEFVVKEEKVDSSLDKAMQSYEEFLKQTPETDMTPEAIRRLADLKIQKDYTDAVEAAEKRKEELKKQQEAAELPAASDGVTPVADSAAQSTDMSAPTTGALIAKQESEQQSIATGDSPIADVSESESDFADRAGKKIDLGKSTKEILAPEGAEDDAIAQQQAGAQEAIELYKGLLEKYPLFERNDQVMYQLSRAYGQSTPAKR